MRQATIDSCMAACEVAHSESLAAAKSQYSLHASSLSLKTHRSRTGADQPTVMAISRLLFDCCARWPHGDIGTRMRLSSELSPHPTHVSTRVPTIQQGWSPKTGQRTECSSACCMVSRHWTFYSLCSARRNNSNSLYTCCPETLFPFHSARQLLTQLCTMRPSSSCSYSSSCRCSLW